MEQQIKPHRNLFTPTIAQKIAGCHIGISKAPRDTAPYSNTAYMDGCRFRMEAPRPLEFSRQTVFKRFFVSLRA